MSEQKKRKHSSEKKHRAGSRNASRDSLVDVGVSGATEHSLKSNGSHGQHRHHSQNHKGAVKTASHDRVRKIVQEEGRAARNLIAWNVPLESDGNKEKATGSRNRSPLKRVNAAGTADQGRESSPGGASSKKSQDDSSSQKSASRPSSAIGGRKVDPNARYWALLFDNLKRAVDGIYRTCEVDESVDECKEAIMMLEQCTKDFKSLIEQWNVEKVFKQAEETGRRPSSLAWEVRKTSPGKLHLSGHERGTPSPARGAHTQTPPLQRPGLALLASSGEGSWAERVKGWETSGPPHTIPESTSPVSNGPLIHEGTGPIKLVKPSPIKPIEEDDIEGWETVRRSRGRGSPPNKAPHSGGHPNSKFQKPLRSPANGHTGSGDHNGKHKEAEISKANGAPIHGGNHKDVPVESPALKSSTAQSGQSEPAKAIQSGKKSYRDVTARRTQSGRQSDRPNQQSARPVSESQGTRPTSAQQSSRFAKPQDNAARKPRSANKAKNYSTTSNAVPVTQNSSSNKIQRHDAKYSRKPSQSNNGPNSNDSHSGKKPSVGLPKQQEAPPLASSSKIKTNMEPVGESDEEVLALNLEGDDSDEEISQATHSSTLKGSSTLLPESSSLPAVSEQSDGDPPELPSDDHDLTPKVTLQASEVNIQGSDLDDSAELTLEDGSDFEDEEAIMENQLDQEQSAALESAIEAEEGYLAQLKKEQTDLEAEGDLANPQTSAEDGLSMSQSMDWETLVARYDAETERLQALGISWGDMVDESETRTPGRGVHMHEKLSSPSRKRPIQESKKRYEEKQAKAEKQREKLMAEKADRMKDLLKKVEEARTVKDNLLQQKKDRMEKKLQRAYEKRTRQLKMKVKKAHEEETKANEIAFINTLEAANKRHDILSKHKGFENRLQDLQEERQRKIDEKLAKEAAVEERRKALEAERVSRLREMQGRRKEREVKIEQAQQERERERLETMKAREKEHRDRVASLNLQDEERIKDLQRKIQEKQDATMKRHNENLQQIREKAFVMSILKHSTEDHNDAPNIDPYQTQKLCTVCSVLIPSEVHLLSHLRGKQHKKMLKEHTAGKDLDRMDIEAFNVEHIVDAPGDTVDPRAESTKERHKVQKKRYKRLRTRMQSRGNEFEAGLANKQETCDSENKTKLNKLVRDLTKALQAQESGVWPADRVSQLERYLGEATRVLERKVFQDQAAFRILGGISVITRLLQLMMPPSPGGGAGGGSSIASTPSITVLPSKTFVNLSNVIRFSCRGSYENCHYILYSNRLGTLIDLLIDQLTTMLPEHSAAFNRCWVVHSKGSDGPAQEGGPVVVPVDPVVASLTTLLATVLGCLASQNPLTRSSSKSAERMSNSGSGDAFTHRINDAVSYLINVGAVDKFHRLVTGVRSPIDDDSVLASFLQSILQLLTAMTKLVSKRTLDVFSFTKSNDATTLLQTFEGTELAGILSLLYGILIHSEAATRGEGGPSPEALPAHTIGVVLTGLRLLSQLALVDLSMLQQVLGAEGTSLELRHICSHLIWYCGHHKNDELLHEVILIVGYFTVANPENQVLVQAGQPPTLLQQLCGLPFEYFSDPALVGVLFPTLVCAAYECLDNKRILSQELSTDLLSNYIEVPLALKSLDLFKFLSLPVDIADKQEQIFSQQQEPRSAASSSSLSSTSSARKQLFTGKDRSPELEGKMSFSVRFPKANWQSALGYFSNS